MSDDVVGPRQPFRVFTSAEKRELAGCHFHRIALDAVDFSRANLIGAWFRDVSLKGCDFTGADLRATQFLRCDLRGAALAGVLLGGNRFQGSCLAGATGLDDQQQRYVCRRGGTFVDWNGDAGTRLRLIK